MLITPTINMQGDNQCYTNQCWRTVCTFCAGQAAIDTDLPARSCRFIPPVET